eukprot:2288027-Rhodomonas_salina.1
MSLAAVLALRCLSRSPSACQCQHTLPRQCPALTWCVSVPGVCRAGGGAGGARAQKLPAGIYLRNRYAMPGTDVAYAAARRCMAVPLWRGRRSPAPEIQHGKPLSWYHLVRGSTQRRMLLGCGTQTRARSAEQDMEIKSETNEVKSETNGPTTSRALPDVSLASRQLTPRSPPQRTAARGQLARAQPRCRGRWRRRVGRQSPRACLGSRSWSPPPQRSLLFPQPPPLQTASADSNTPFRQRLRDAHTPVGSSIGVCCSTWLAAWSTDLVDGAVAERHARVVVHVNPGNPAASRRKCQHRHHKWEQRQQNRQIVTLKRKNRQEPGTQGSTDLRSSQFSTTPSEAATNWGAGTPEVSAGHAQQMRGPVP